MSIVKVQNVYKSYPLGEATVAALNGVTADIEVGEFLAIAGPSGSGKSTLLNMIGCIDKVDAGEILIDGRDTSVMSSNELADLRASRIGFIFQTFNLLPVLSALENVEFPLLNANGLGRRERRERAMRFLEIVGLTDKANQRPRQLSGGQRQRVAIARALATEPLLVLADEPTANLDQRTSEEILSFMQRINQDLGVTFVFSTHDQQVMATASRILYMIDGKLGPQETSEVPV